MIGVTKAGIDKLKDAGRDEAPFELARRRGRDERRYLASAVIDASGTWTRPNPLGAGGLPAAGERALADRIVYGIPDVLGEDRARYAGKRVLVVGSGHSAFNAILDLVALRESAPATQIVWAIRGGAPGRKYGGGGDDQLPARGALGAAVRALVADGSIALASGFQTRAVSERDGSIVLADGEREIAATEVIAATGFRPDLSLLGELRLALDDRVEAARALAPLIDPNLHSCGSVPPHGVDELSHPDDGVYMVGMKSYGRAPTFLLRTGYEQVRSVVAALAGDWEGARRVELILPETGVCSGGAAARLPPPAIGVLWRRLEQRPGHRRGAVTAHASTSHPGPRGARGPGASSARSRSPRPSPGASSTTPSPRFWCRCSATSATPPRSSPARSRSHSRRPHCAGFAVGRHLDRHSPRALMTAGSIAGAALVVAWSQVDGLAAFYVALGSQSAS